MKYYPECLILSFYDTREYKLSKVSPWRNHRHKELSTIPNIIFRFATNDDRVDRNRIVNTLNN